MKGEGKSRRKLVLEIAAGVVAGVLVAVGLCAAWEHACRTRGLDGLEDAAGELEAASICITARVEGGDESLSGGGADDAGDVEEISYGPCGSGVVFERDGDRCYALTAAHVVDTDSKEGDWELHAMTASYETPDEWLERGGFSEGGLESYWVDSLAEIEVEYVSGTADVAVVSFETDEDVGTVELAADDGADGDADGGSSEKIAVTGTIDDEPFTTVSGTVLDVSWDFGSDEWQKGADTRLASTYVTEGASGSGAVNADGELTGIVIGGAGALSFQLMGILATTEEIEECIEEWRAL